ncbi:MAG: site-2 protease family protein [Pirellulales bacterium]
MDHITPDFLVLGLGWYAVFLIAITCHEAAHAWSAMLLGDPTGYYAGQVTLNPGPHISREPLGTVVVPVITYLLNGLMLGWASAPYDPHWEIQSPRRALLMALAGPLANLVLVVIAGIVLRIGFHAGWFHDTDPFTYVFSAQGFPTEIAARIMVLFAIMFTLNLILFVFNLIPLPPLDGSAIWPVVLSPRALTRYLEFRSQPSFVILGIIVAASVFPRVFWPVESVARRLLELS